MGVNFKISAAIAGCVALHTAFGCAAQAQQFPAKTITVLVGYTAGGGADALARVVGQRLSEALKVPVVVENRPGANGLIAAQAAANSKPDGHTILLVTDAMVTIEPQLPGPAKFDPSTALEPLVNLATAPLLIAANKDVPVDSISALAEYGKKNPNSLSFGTSGNATPHRLSGEMLQKQGGFQMKHVPYKGTSASVTDVLGGQISLVIGTVPALESHAKSGKVKLLGVTSEKRSPLLPNVPAVSETYPGFDVVTYFGLMVPKNTPKPVIETLNREVNKVLSSPEMKEPFTRLGVVPVGGSASEFKAKINTDYQTHGTLIRELNIQAE